MADNDAAAGCRARYMDGRVVLDAWAPGRAECVAQAVRGLVHDAVWPADAVLGAQDVERIRPLPDRDLLAHVLRRTIAHLARDGLVPADVTVAEDDDGRVTLALTLVPNTQLRRMPDLGTGLGDVVLERTDMGWRCHAIIAARPLAPPDEGFVTGGSTGHDHGLPPEAPARP
ncbi:hypothetical protein GCM10009733_059890 [Nonomuraea maheshkhaliensis]|uniref:SnoaL-like domain-containing protein n=1 Tax=Nonomuraea maheshkhaliensis TaxID=419590 RepID=A0ABN2FN24_9ACTN